MSTIKRWNQILDILSTERAITVDDLCERLGISPSTARRDFSAMEEQGLIKRIPGGAQAISTNAAPAALPIDERMTQNLATKQAIAQAAAALVRDNDSVFLDSSSTVYYMLDQITARNVTITTNSLHIAFRAKDLMMRTYLLNGFVEQSGRIMDEGMAAKIAEMNISKAFLGTFGISNGFGLTTNNTLEVEYKRRLIERAAQSYTLADDSKFDIVGLYSYGSLADTLVITNKAPGGYEGMSVILAG